MTKRRLAGFTVGLFALLALVFVHWFEPILGYTTPKWAFVVAAILAVVVVQYLWKHEP